MPETVEILCLANSFKHGGRCVAGLRADGAGWVRPVGKSRDRIVTDRHYFLPDFTEVRPLDLLRVTLDAPAPQPHHPEDWFMTLAPWELVERPAPREVAVPVMRGRFCRGPALLGCTEARQRHSRFERRPATESLTLIRPEEVRWKVTGEAGKRKSRACFRLGAGEEATWYDLPITDPEFLSRLDRLPVGEHPQEAVAGISDSERLIFTVSRGEPRRDAPDPAANGWCYKLVAAVIAIPSEWRGKAAGT